MATCKNAYKTKYTDLIVCRKSAANATNLTESARGACIKQHYCGQAKTNILDTDCAGCPRLIETASGELPVQPKKKKFPAKPKEADINPTNQPTAISAENEAPITESTEE